MRPSCRGAIRLDTVESKRRTLRHRQGQNQRDSLQTFCHAGSFRALGEKAQTSKRSAYSNPNIDHCVKQSPLRKGVTSNDYWTIPRRHLYAPNWRK